MVCSPQGAAMIHRRQANIAPMVCLYPGREPDRQARSRFDRKAQQRIDSGFRRAVGKRGVAMLDFLGAEFLDPGGKLGVALAQLLGLRAVMLVDHLFDRDRAGHCRPFAQEGGGSAQREARHMPERVERARPHAALDHEPVEGLEMARFLACHMAQDRPQGAFAEDAKLALIDPLRAIFAGLIDADYLPEPFPGARIAGKPHARRREKAAPARSKDASTFHPASEMPKSAHCGSSHRTLRLARIWARSSAIEAAVPLAVQALGPGNQCCSTP